MANIAEGFGRSGSAEFVQLLAVAKGSALEAISHIYVAADQRYITLEEFDRLHTKTESVIHVIGGLMKYLQRSVHKGAKFKR